MEAGPREGERNLGTGSHIRTCTNLGLKSMLSLLGGPWALNSFFLKLVSIFGIVFYFLKSPHKYSRKKKKNIFYQESHLCSFKQKYLWDSMSLVTHSKGILSSSCTAGCVDVHIPRISSSLAYCLWADLGHDEKLQLAIAKKRCSYLNKTMAIVKSQRFWG